MKAWPCLFLSGSLKCSVNPLLWPAQAAVRWQQEICAGRILGEEVFTHFWSVTLLCTSQPISHHSPHSLRCKLFTILSEEWPLHCVAVELKEEIQRMKVEEEFREWRWMPSWRRKEFGWEREVAAHAFFLWNLLPSGITGKGWAWTMAVLTKVPQKVVSQSI